MIRRSSHQRILAIVPMRKGFSFAVLDAGSVLADWGSKHVSGDRHKQSLKKVQRLVAHYQPDLLILEEMNHSRRVPRTRTLIKTIGAWATAANVTVESYPLAEVRRRFFPDAAGTKDDFAAALAERLPESLKHVMPPLRRSWMSEDVRMCTFEAVALALMPGMKRASSSKGHADGY